MWPHFEGKARTRDESLAYINQLKWTDWSPKGITLHNTAAPTLAQWAESGPNHDARIRNLQSYYENELGWHAGPHFFVSRNWINWFSNPLLPGVHSRCWNATRFGIEMAGDFTAEQFDSGDGAMVRDNAVFLIAALNNKFGFSADDLTFHKECTLDNHDCPGHNVKKPDVIARVKVEMARQKGGASSPAPVSIPAPAPAPPAVQPPAGQTFANIVATEFGGGNDYNTSAYDGHVINDREVGVALPFHFAGHPPRVVVIGPRGTATCDIVDVGPWNTNDPYWKGSGRPQAESGRDMRGRTTNKAGIDLTPAAARLVGVDGKGVVSWRFA